MPLPWSAESRNPRYVAYHAELESRETKIAKSSVGWLNQKAELGSVEAEGSKKAPLLYGQIGRRDLNSNQPTLATNSLV